MPEQHVKLMQGLGIDQALIDQVEKVTPDEAKTWDPAPVQDAVKNVLKNQFLNDDEFLKTIPEEKIPAELKKKLETGQATRFQNEMKDVAMKKLGLEEKDFENLTKSEKDSVIKAMTERIATTYLTKKGNTQGLQEMQEQVRKLNEQLEGKDADWEEKMNSKLAEVNGSSNVRLIKALVRGQIATLDGVELTVPAGYVTDPILAKLQNQYTLVLGDNDEILLRQKSNPELKVMDGSKEVTFEQALKKQILADKVGKEKSADGGEGEEGKDGKKKKVTIGGGGEGSEEITGVPDYIKDKMKDNLDIESKASK